MKYLVAASLTFLLGCVIYLRFLLDDRTKRINTLESQIKEWAKLSSQSFMDSVGCFLRRILKLRINQLQKNTY
jgi:hypothetical protein